MPSALPDGEPVPENGRLPAERLAQIGVVPLGAYVHVPFCASRCGYCDFNTYTAQELNGTASPDGFVDAAVSEMRLARSVLGDAPALSTVFFGGGTPTLLPASDLCRLLDVLRSEFSLAPDAEVSIEANPESVSLSQLRTLREGGFNRLSIGMQSAVPSVLNVLERAHSPGGVEQAVTAARQAGFDDLSLDLIYGAPGETVDEWRTSLETAASLQPNHVSAYSLIVEPGTRLARLVARRELVAPDDDQQAEKYEMTDDVLTEHGYRWYEVSNWERGGRISRHNLGYWLSHDWWGFGPGAHSHVAGVRWWNVKHPNAYAQRLERGSTPALAREVLDEPTRDVERVMLQVRLRKGLVLKGQTSNARRQSAALVREGLLDAAAFQDGHARLTNRGRLLADLVVRRLLAD